MADGLTGCRSPCATHIAPDARKRLWRTCFTGGGGVNTFFNARKNKIKQLITGKKFMFLPN
jgi:hypothetical protein